MLKFVFFFAAALAVASLGVWSAPAQATTFGFDDEVLVHSGTAFNTYWSGATGSASTSALYQETQTASGGGVVITRLTTGVSLGVPGEYVQNTLSSTGTNGQGLFLSGWGQSLNYGQTVGFVYNTALSNAFLAYETNTTSGIGGLQATRTNTTFDSIDLKGSGTATFIGEDQNGNQVAGDTKTVTLTSSWQTVTLDWSGVALLSFTSSFGSTDQVQMDNVVVGNAVPEPSTLLLFAGGLLGLAGYRMRSKKA